MHSFQPLQAIEQTLIERARAIRLAAFDVDGTMTDGRICYTATGIEIKCFHAHDGHGLKQLMQAGIHVAIITARQSEAVHQRAHELGITHVFQAVKNKRQCLSELQQQLTLDVSQTLFAGDDVGDIPAMTVSHLAVAVANAHPLVKQQAHWITTRKGGAGAVREIADMVLAAQQSAQGAT